MGFNPSGSGISAASDVAFDAPTTNNVLTYDSSISKWKNANVNPKTIGAVAKGELYLNVMDFGAKGDGVTDDTTAIQAAIDAGQAVNNNASSAGGATVIFPKSIGNYRYTKLLIINDNASYLTLQGAGNAILQPIVVPGEKYSITIGGSGTSSQATGDAAGGNKRIRINNIMIYADGYWNSPNQIDQVGIYVYRAQGVTFDDVWIAGFKQGAILAGDLYDCIFTGLRIFSCGFSEGDSDGQYAYAITFQGINDCSNANHFQALHMEHCPLMIHFKDGARWTQVVNSKFELGPAPRTADNSTLSAFWFESARENTFVNCMFTTNRMMTKYLIKADQLRDTYELANNIRSHHNFVACQFFGNSYSKSMWFTGYDSSFSDCIFNRSNGTDGPAFRFFDNNTMTHSRTTFADGGVQFLDLQGTGNAIDLPIIQGNGDSPIGPIFNIGASATQNLVRDPRFISLANVSNIVLLSTSLADLGSNVIEGSTRPFGVVNGGSTVNVFLRRIMHLAFSSATNVTDFTQGHVNQRVLIKADNGNATIVHNSGTISLKGGANRTLNTNESMEFINDAGVWREI